ncbi:MAG: pyridoxamine 5'-phosphate oxidase [Bacteroidia bacterium]
MKELSKKLRELRNQYKGEPLSIERLDKNPFMRFRRWMEAAVQVGVEEPSAMILGTADIHGKPSVRTVLLKELSEKGFVFYTNYNSRKGKEINENPYGSLLFFWPRLQRQIRIEGVLEKTDPAQCEKYFNERPEGSRISAWVSPQSAIIESKSELEEKYVEFEKKYKGKEIPYPAFWGGYCLKPLLFEFWQGQPNRLHDRVQYCLNEENNTWATNFLAP